MPKSVPLVRIVLCSPGDVQIERNAVATIVEETNRLVAKHLGVRLELWRWETDGDMRARAWSFTLQAELELLVEDENAAIDPLRQSETIASAIGQAGAEYRDQLRKFRTLSTQKGIVEIVERELSRVTIARERTESRLTRVRS